MCDMSSGMESRQHGMTSALYIQDSGYGESKDTIPSAQYLAIRMNDTLAATLQGQGRSGGARRCALTPQTKTLGEHKDVLARGVCITGGSGFGFRLAGQGV